MEPMASNDISLIEQTWTCHEVVVQHADASFECAGGECELDVRVHRFVVACAEVDCPDCRGVLLAA
jgi:hypothetical protein